MHITVRSYRPLADFEPVRQFLLRHHRPFNQDGNFHPMEWEYMHTHSLLPYNKLSRFGVWENAGEIVAVVNIEFEMGEVMFQLNPAYSFLKGEMLDYAEQNLYGTDEAGRRYLRVSRLHDGDHEMHGILQARGYQKTGNDEWIGFFDLTKPVPECEIPEGFTIHSLQDENDMNKINRVLWRGFDHGDGPTPEPDTVRVMQSGPRFNPALNMVVKAPNGDYAVYCGMWFEPVHRDAYLEPLCTDPDYRRMGLGKAALYEAMRRAQDLGAVRCGAGGQDFYKRAGFIPCYSKQDWHKYLDT